MSYETALGFLLLRLLSIPFSPPESPPPAHHFLQCEVFSVAALGGAHRTHIFMQELPEQNKTKHKTLQLVYLFLHCPPPPSPNTHTHPHSERSRRYLGCARCPTRSLDGGGGAIVTAIMIISAIMCRGCVGVVGGGRGGTWQRRGGWVKSEGSRGRVPRLPDSKWTPMNPISGQPLCQKLLFVSSFSAEAHLVWEPSLCVTHPGPLSQALLHSFMSLSTH